MLLGIATSHCILAPERDVCSTTKLHQNSLHFKHPGPGWYSFWVRDQAHKLTRPRQKGSGASPVSSSGIGRVQSDPISSDSDSGSLVAKAPKLTFVLPRVYLLYLSLRNAGLFNGKSAFS